MCESLDSDRTLSNYRSGYSGGYGSTARYAQRYNNCGSNLNQDSCETMKWWGTWSYQERRCCSEKFNVRSYEEVDAPEPTTAEVSMIEEILKADTNMSYLDSNKFIN